MTGQDLTKLSVNLIPQAVVSLDLACEVTGDHATDTVNRALQVYGFLVDLDKRGHLVFIEHPESGKRERLILL